MPRNQNRVTNLALEMAGIQQGDLGPKVSDNIQMTYLMGDLSALLAPIRPLYFWTRASASATPIHRAAFTLQSPPDAAVVVDWMENVTGGGAALLYKIVDADPLTILTNNDPPDWASGGPPQTGLVSRSRLSEGQILGAGVGALGGVILLPDAASLPDRTPPIVITPSRFFIVFGAADNVAMILNISFREVPVPDATTPT